MVAIHTKKYKFKEKEMNVCVGKTHPAYSFDTFTEEEDFRNKYWNIKEKDVVFDIGASYGSYTFAAASAGGTVYAFEPETNVLLDLINNIQINQWEAPIFPFGIGFWDHEGIINMKDYAPHWPPQSISSNYIMTTIDKFVQEKEIHKLDWIKIDVEGAEENVVKGGLKTIQKFKPQMIIECHIFLDANLKDKIKNMLTDIYNIEEINRDPCVMLYCTAK